MLGWFIERMRNPDATEKLFMFVLVFWAILGLAQVVKLIIT